VPIKLPLRNNQKLARLLRRINRDAELRQWWRSANINAMDRSGMSDHGEVHIRIVANAALKLLRLLDEAGIPMSVVAHHKLTRAEAEVIVVLAACLHDVGLIVHRDDHERYSLILGAAKARQLLEGLYPEPERTAIIGEVLHAMIAHRWDVRALTIEASALKVADALDMTEGRTRIPFRAGEVNIHSVSAAAIESVNIQRGKEGKPIVIEIAMNTSAGIFQVDELLKRKLSNSLIAPYVQVNAKIESETEKRLVEVYSL
jgi:metal-dependent HD superfamily phosphatase/phosphodiesterase